MVQVNLGSRMTRDTFPVAHSFPLLIQLVNCLSGQILFWLKATYSLMSLAQPIIPNTVVQLIPRISPTAPPISEKNCVASYSTYSKCNVLCSGFRYINTLVNMFDWLVNLSPWYFPYWMCPIMSSSWRHFRGQWQFVVGSNCAVSCATHSACWTKVQTNTDLNFSTLRKPNDFGQQRHPSTTSLTMHSWWHWFCVYLSYKSRSM